MDLSRACMAIFSAAFFTPLVFSPIAAWASAAPIDTVPPTMSGMNRFLRQGGKNKLVFDAVSAKRAGYSDRDLKIVSSQIRLMNMLLSEGRPYFTRTAPYRCGITHPKVLREPLRGESTEW